MPICVDCGYESEDKSRFLGSAKVLEDVWRCRPCGGFIPEPQYGGYPKTVPVIDANGAPSRTVTNPTAPAEEPEDWREA